MIISIGLCIFNLIQIDWENPLRDKSSIAVIGVIASASSFLLILILIISKKIAIYKWISLIYYSIKNIFIEKLQCYMSFN